MRREPDVQQALEAVLTFDPGCEARSYLESVAHLVKDLLEVDWTIITVAHGESAHVVASTTKPFREVVQIHGLVGERIHTTGLPVVVEDAQYGAPGRLPDGFAAFLGLPLHRGEELIGTLCSFHRAPKQFAHERVELVRMLCSVAAKLVTRLQQLEDREQLAALGEATAMLVHELKNPLAVMMLGLGARDPQLGLIRAEAARLERLVHDVLGFAGPLQLRKERVDLGELVAKELDAWRAMPEALGHTVSLTIAPGKHEALADPQRVLQALTNLVRNACEAATHAEPVRVSVDRHAQFVVLRVHNDGVIPQHLLAKLPAPFLTTKPGGTGLGLSVAEKIARAHGGELRIVSRKGTDISLRLPTAS